MSRYRQLSRLTDADELNRIKRKIHSLAISEVIGN
jgi:hypothetical protein